MSADFDKLNETAKRLRQQREADDRSAAPLALPPELAPVEAFPLHALPVALRPWVEDVAERMQCPADFVGVPMLVAAASLAARQVAIKPEQHTDWREHANLWALIVGRPGVMKSPAMGQALAPIDRLEGRAAEDYKIASESSAQKIELAKVKAELAFAELKKRLKAGKEADTSEWARRQKEAALEEPPTRARYVVNDTSYEKLGETLSENPHGVLIVRDEMRGFFLHLSREEQAAARAFFLQSWSGGRYTFDRITRGIVTVEDLRLSIIGGIQPGPLSDLVLQARRGAADDGMLDRFLVAWPDDPGEWRECDRPPNAAAQRAAWETFDRLDRLHADELHARIDLGYDGEQRGLAYLRFDDDARTAFRTWRAELEKRLRTGEAEAVESALAKFRHHVPALALTLHVVAGGSGPVSLQATLGALALAEYFESHAYRTHGSGRRQAVRGARSILAKIKAGKLPTPFTARDVYRQQWSGLSDRRAVADVLDLLAAHNWVVEATIETGGRPTVVYTPAPEVFHG